MLESYHRGAYESPTSFVTKLYEMVSQEPNEIISFIPDGSAFEIRNPKKLERDILASYFRHKKFQSLIRQLNFYNFKKDRGVWIYRHQMFHRDHPNLLSKLKRKTNSVAFPNGCSHSKKKDSSNETDCGSSPMTPLDGTNDDYGYERNENELEEPGNMVTCNDNIDVETKKNKFIDSDEQQTTGLSLSIETDSSSSNSESQDNFNISNPKRHKIRRVHTNWFEIQDTKQKAVYYYNFETGESDWKLPDPEKNEYEISKSIGHSKTSSCECCSQRIEKQDIQFSQEALQKLSAQINFESCQKKNQQTKDNQFDSTPENLINMTRRRTNTDMLERIAATTILALNPTKFKTNLQIQAEKSKNNQNIDQQTSENLGSDQESNFNEQILTLTNYTNWDDNHQCDQKIENEAHDKNGISDEDQIMKVIQFHKKFDDSLKNSISPVQNKRKSFFEKSKRSPLIETSEQSSTNMNDKTYFEQLNQSNSTSDKSPLIRNFSKSLFQQSPQELDSKNVEKCLDTATQDQISEFNSIDFSPRSKLTMTLNILQQFDMDARDSSCSVYMYRSLLMHNPEINIDFLNYCSALDPNKDPEVSSGFRVFCLFLISQIGQLLIENCSESFDSLSQLPLPMMDDSSIISSNSSSLYAKGDCEFGNQSTNDVQSYLRFWIGHLRSIL